jgi:hypothetical protein
VSRCWLSLFAKNVAANTPLFGVMFAADFYSKISTVNREAAASAAQGTTGDAAVAV